MGTGPAAPPAAASPPRPGRPPHPARHGSWLDRGAYTLGRWSGHGASLPRGGVAMAGLAAAYTVVMALLARQGATPVPEPALRIASETYYLWAVTFTGPVLLAGWLVAAAAMQLAARAAGGTGTFEELADALGLVTALASLTTLLPDLVMGLTGTYGGPWAATWFGRTLTTAWLSAYVVLFLAAYPIVLRHVHRLPRTRCVAIGVAGFTLYQGVLFVFIR